MGNLKIATVEICDMNTSLADTDSGFSDRPGAQALFCSLTDESSPDDFRNITTKFLSVFLIQEKRDPFKMLWLWLLQESATFFCRTVCCNVAICQNVTRTAGSH